MRPNRYSIREGVTHFHYTYQELHRFLEEGFMKGDVGMILVKREKDFFTYKGFGTIEAPSNGILTMTMKHLELFDGKMLTDDALVAKSVKNFDKHLQSYSFKILNFTNPLK